MIDNKFRNRWMRRLDKCFTEWQAAMVNINLGNLNTPFTDEILAVIVRAHRAEWAALSQGEKNFLQGRVSWTCSNWERWKIDKWSVLQDINRYGFRK